MIGRKEWFTTKRLVGVGLTPVRWQGWVYLAVFLAGILSLQYLSDLCHLKLETRLLLIFGWLAIALADMLHIWITLKGK